MAPVRTQRQAGTPTKQAIRRFLRYSQRFSENTKRQYRDALWLFCAAMPDFVEQITPESIDQFIMGLKMLNSSKNTRLIPIRSFFRFCEDYLGLPNPAKKVKDLRNQPPRQRVISEIEYSKLLEIAKPNERAVIRFLANTGLRATEFAELTPQGISPDQKYMTVIGKGQKRRTVPLNDTCRECLTMIFSKSYVSRNSLYCLCLSLSKRADLPVFGPHAFRHYFITELIKRGVPIAIVSKIAGHSSPVITMSVYCHLLVPDFVGATDCLDSVIE